MTIDGYFVPDALAEGAQAKANQSGTTQHVGLLYNREDLPPRTLFGSIPFFADARVGRFCTWVYGPEYDELKALDKLAVILWISPRRAA